MYKLPRKLAGGVPDPVSWALACRSVRGKPLDHRVQPFTVEPLLRSAYSMEDGERGIEMAFMKGRQLGMTTAGMTLGFWHLDVHGGMTLHAVPTKGNSEKIHDTILMPNLRQTKFRNLRQGGVWSKTVKSFDGEGISASYVLGHTLGGNATADGDVFRSLTAELAFFDERGTMPEAACAVVESCLDVCDNPVIWNVGSAGFKGDALDRFFRGGTMAEWAIPCDSCGKHTVLVQYGDGVTEIENCLGRDGDDLFYQCEHCHRPINPQLGDWVHNEGPYPSYHAASMISAFFPAYKLQKKLDNPNTTEESLMREVAGLPYGGQGVTIDPQDIRRDEPAKDAPTRIAGVDWGSTSRFLIISGTNDKMVVQAFGQVDGKHDQHVDQLLEELAHWHPDWIGCDSGFEGGRNEKMNDHTGCAWSMVSSLSPRPGNVYVQVERDRRKKAYRFVKTWVWERIVEDIRRGKLTFGPGTEAVIEHVLAVTPEIDKGKQKNWVSYDTTRQHYAACLLYAYAIFLREANKRSGPSVGQGNPMTNRPARTA